MANAVNDSILYEELRLFINEKGGVPKKFISIPPNYINLDNDEETEWEEELEYDTEHIPNQKELTKLVKENIDQSEDIYSIFNLSMRFLTDNAIGEYWSKHIINALYE